MELTGIIRDVDTKQPLSDIHVEYLLIGRFGTEVFLSSRTDKNGRYRILGLPKSDTASLVKLHVRPGPSQPYFRTNAEVTATVKGGKPTDSKEIELKRAVWLAGKVTDKVTGKPIQALVAYCPFVSNPHVLRLRKLSLRSTEF